MKCFKFISLILLAVICGCSNDEPKPQPTPEPTPDPDEGWVWDYYLAEVDIVIEDVDGNNLFRLNITEFLIRKAFCRCFVHISKRNKATGGGWRQR